MMAYYYNYMDHHGDTMVPHIVVESMVGGLGPMVGGLIGANGYGRWCADGYGRWLWVDRWLGPGAVVYGADDIE